MKRCNRHVWKFVSWHGKAPSTDDICLSWWNISINAVCVGCGKADVIPARQKDADDERARRICTRCDEEHVVVDPSFVGCIKALKDRIDQLEDRLRSCEGLEQHDFYA